MYWSRLHGKAYVEKVAIRRIQSGKMTGGGLGQLHLLKKASATIKGLKNTCASLKAALSSYFSEKLCSENLALICLMAPSSPLFDGLLLQQRVDRRK